MSERQLKLRLYWYARALESCHQAPSEQAKEAGVVSSHPGISEKYQSSLVSGLVRYRDPQRDIDDVRRVVVLSIAL